MVAGGKPGIRQRQGGGRLAQKVAVTQWRSTGASGRADPAWLESMHTELAALLRERLGYNHATMLASPRVDDRGQVTWSTPLTGPLAALTDLPPADAQRLRERALRLREDVSSLVGELSSTSGGDMRIAALQAMLQRASSDQAAWYSVGGKPVLIDWMSGSGSPSERAPSPTVGVAAAAAGPGAAAAVSVDSPSGTTATPPANPPVVQPGGGAAPRRWPWWLGMIVMLVLLALVLWRCTPAGPATGPLKGQVDEIDERNQEIEAEIRRRRSATLECRLDEQQPPAPPPAPEAPQLPPPAAEEPPKPADPPPSAPAPRTQPKPVEPKPQPPKPAASAPKPSMPPQAPQPEPAPRAVAPEPPTAQANRPPGCAPREKGEEPEVIVIVDASGSMRDPMPGAASRLDAAKRGAEQTIRSLPQDVDVALVEFSDCGRVRRDKFYSAPERGALVGEINRLEPQRGTPLADAIRRAGQIASDSAPSAIVVVSDGGDSCGGDPCAVARAVRASKPNVTINVIDVSTSAADRQILQCVASAGGGRVMRPGDAPELGRAMRQATGAAQCPP